MRLLIFLLTPIFIFVANTAFAGDDQSGTTISLAPLFNELLEYIVVIVVAVIGWGFSRLAGYLRKWLGIRVDDSQRAVVMGAVERGVNYAADQLRQKMAESNKLSIDFRSLLIATAVKYVQARVPDALIHFKLTPKDVGDMVAAKLEEFGTIDKIATTPASASEK